MSNVSKNPSGLSDNDAGVSSLGASSLGASSAGTQSNDTGSGGTSPWLNAAQRLPRQPRFVLAALFLLLSGVGLNAATQFLQLHFRKVAVPLPVKSLSDETEGIPPRMGGWVQASTDEPLDPETEGQLGTKEYVNRVYIDSRLDPAKAKSFNGASRKDRAAQLDEFVRNYGRDHQDQLLVPALTMSLTYYTGLVDTVAHIPERCYVANGYDLVSNDVEVMARDGFSDQKARDVNFRFDSFEDQTGQEHGVFVAYFFKVNGKYTEDPLEVRRTLQDLTEKYGYYAKLEIKATRNDPVRSQTAQYRAAVEKAIRDFIASALPEIDSRLPDWQMVKAKRG